MYVHTYLRTYVIEQDGSAVGQSMSAEYGIPDGHRVSPPGNPTKTGGLVEENRRNDGDMNYMTTGRASGRRKRQTGRRGNSMLRPTPNHGTLQ